MGAAHAYLRNSGHADLIPLLPNTLGFCIGIDYREVTLVEMAVCSGTWWFRLRGHEESQFGGASEPLKRNGPNERRGDAFDRERVGVPRYVRARRARVTGL